MSEPVILSIDIWSDVMCPWCLVGWGNLRIALDQLAGEIAADIRWHAFELNPAMPPEGEEATAHIARKYGRPSSGAAAMQRMVEEAGHAAGVSLAYEGPEPAPPAMLWNTFAAHTLLAWAGETHGGARQTELMLALCRAHWNKRRRIGEQEVLLEVAQEAGFGRTEVAAALDDPRWAEQVRAEERTAAERNITGVPAFVVAGGFLIPGAQPPETFVTVLRRVAAKNA